jgi:hypothetical protein
MENGFALLKGGKTHLVLVDLVKGPEDVEDSSLDPGLGHDVRSAGVGSDRDGGETGRGEDGGRGSDSGSRSSSSDSGGGKAREHLWVGAGVCSKEG